MNRRLFGKVLGTVAGVVALGKPEPCYCNEEVYLAATFEWDPGEFYCGDEIVLLVRDSDGSWRTVPDRVPVNIRKHNERSIYILSSVKWE